MSFVDRWIKEKEILLQIVVLRFIFEIVLITNVNFMERWNKVPIQIIWIDGKENK